MDDVIFDHEVESTEMLLLEEKRGVVVKRCVVGRRHLEGCEEWKCYRMLAQCRNLRVSYSRRDAENSERAELRATRQDPFETERCTPERIRELDLLEVAARR